MTVDKPGLRKMPPEERLKKLKEMEKKRKEEVGEIGELIKQSMKDLKTEKLATKIAPEQREVDISQLFERNEGEELERTTKQEFTTARPGTTYQTISQMYNDYSQLKEFYGMVSSGVGLSKDQLSSIGKIGERMNVAEKYMSEGEKTISILNPSRTILYKLKKETGLD